MKLTSWWRSRSADRFRQARDRGVSWLLTRQRPDGGIEAYYKALSAFLAGGESTAASRVCRWIRAHEITASGDFGRGPREKKGERFAYVNAWIVIGAHRCAAFDVSQRGMDFLLQFRDPTSGGFYSSRTSGGDDTRQDLMVVGFCGLAAIHTGRLDIARGVGAWLQALLEMQPDFPARLYTVYSRRHGLHTTFPAEEQRRFVVSSTSAEDQLFFQAGIAAAFLVHLFEATGELAWLDGGRSYMRFAEAATDHQFGTLRAGKIGWAAALLYRHTGDSKHQTMARRVGETLLAAQRPRGYWNALGATEPSTDITAEMVVWLDAIHQIS